MPEYSVVGKRVPRVDALSKVTGAAVYSGDVFLPDMLYGKVLRSPYPHAKIKRLDTTKAKTLEGVKEIITAADVPGYKKKSQLVLNELPRLAIDKVIYHGQPVAVVAATSLRIAEEALGLIEVEYEELPAVFDAEEARQPSAPLVHADLYTNTITNPEPEKNDKPSNVAYHLMINRGDVEEGFQKADLVLENTYRTLKVHHGYIEPFAAVARAEASGKVTIWTQSQGIFMARHMLSEFLDMPPGNIKVVPVEIGGAFGGKSYQPVSPFCALLSMKTGRPVRMEMTREEVFRDSRPAPESSTTAKIGVTREGIITAVSVSMVYDAGAFPEMSHAMFASMNGLCQYRIPNLEMDLMDVITNKVPSAFYRAPGTPQIHFAVESQLDLVARELGIDPLQLRMKNLADEGDITPGGEPLPKVGFKETIIKMEEFLEQKGNLEGENRGRGTACGFWHGATGPFGAYVHVNNDGTVNLVLGVTDISGSRTSIAQVVAEELCLPMEKVSVIIGDTDTAPWATQSVGSMTVYSLSLAAYRACQDVKAQLASLAAGKLGVDDSSIEFVDGVFRVKGSPDKSVSFTDLAGSTTRMFGGTGPVVGRGSVAGLPSAPTLSVHTVDLEVDKDTGKVKILSYAIAQDVGRAVNPLSVEGQLQGAVVQGIGWALMEKYSYDRGIMQNPTLLDYRIPTATDVPMIDAMIVEANSPAGVYGLKHAGEAPMVPSLAAIANAIHSATGVRFTELPMNPEAVLNGIKNRR